LLNDLSRLFYLLVCEIASEQKLIEFSRVGKTILKGENSELGRLSDLLSALFEHTNDRFDKSFLLSEALDLHAEFRYQVIVAHTGLLLHVVCSQVQPLQTVENFRLITSMADHDQCFLGLF
jgi:hypothetical protein